MSSRHLRVCMCVRMCVRMCARMCVRVSCRGCISATDDIRALQQSEGEPGFQRKFRVIHCAASGRVQARIEMIIKSGDPERCFIAAAPFFFPRAVTVPFSSEAAQTHRHPAHRLQVRRLLMSYGSQTLSEQST